MRFENAGKLSKPELVTLRRGTHFYCRCGKTKNPPHCDGRHARTGITPLKFMVDGKTEMELCTCGLTGNPPHCDGSHVGY